MSVYFSLLKCAHQLIFLHMSVLKVLKCPKTVAMSFNLKMWSHIMYISCHRFNSQSCAFVNIKWLIAVNEMCEVVQILCLLKKKNLDTCSIGRFAFLTSLISNNFSITASRPLALPMKDPNDLARLQWVISCLEPLNVCTGSETRKCAQYIFFYGTVWQALKKKWISKTNMNTHKNTTFYFCQIKIFHSFNFLGNFFFFIGW